VHVDSMSQLLQVALLVFLQILATSNLLQVLAKVHEPVLLQSLQELHSCLLLSLHH
jgi:hypothetical protein